MYTTIKQSRVVELNPGLHKPFCDHFEKEGLTEQTESFILNIGPDQFENVNDDMIRLTIPYKDANNGYGIVILPKANVFPSGSFSRFERHRLYDVDLGSAYGKLNVKYVDMDGNPCETYESTRYIERYLNYTASAYVQGYNNTSYISGDFSDKYLDPLKPYVLPEVYKDGDKVQFDAYLQTYFPSLEEGEDVHKRVLDYDKYKSNVRALLDKHKEEWMQHPMDVAKSIESNVKLKDSNADIFMRAYLSGVTDRLYFSTVRYMYAAYPPDKTDSHMRDVKVLAEMGLDPRHSESLFAGHRRVRENLGDVSTSPGYQLLDYIIPSPDDDCPFL